MTRWAWALDRRLLWLGGLILLLLTLVRARQAPQRLTAVGPLVFLDHLFDLALVALLLFLALGLGRLALRPLRWVPPAPLLEALAATGLGLGLIAYAILGCGLAGWLSTPALLTLLAALSLIAGRESRASLALVGQAGRQLKEMWWPPAVPVVLPILAGLLLFVGLLQTLGPPGGYDALSYHLAAPQRFIEVGRIVPWPENHPANFPLTIEMLYLGGMLLGSDVFATVLHYALGLLCIVLLADLGARRFSRRAAGLAVLLYVATPMTFFLMQIAYVDFGETFYELLAVAAFVEWREAKEEVGRRNWLILAGVGCGFALGVRFFAGALLALLAAGVVCGRWRQPGQAFRDLLTLSVPAALIAAPWYGKNWLWLGNPVFPFFFGGPDWDPARVQRFAAINDLHGAGHQWVDYLRLPLDLVLHADRFGTFLGSYVSVLWWLPLLAWPLARRHRVLRLLLGLGYLRFILWALSVQQTRYLAPVLPLLYLALGAFLDRALDWRPGPWLRRAVYYPLTLFVTLGLILQLAFFALDACPLPAILGLESRHQFLMRCLVDYPALDYIHQHTPPSARVLFIADGRGYYCQRAYIPDITLETWSYLVSQAAARTPEAVLDVLRARGVTHILYEAYAPWWFAQFDPTGAIRADLELFEVLQARFLDTLYDDGRVRVFRVREGV